MNRKKATLIGLVAILLWGSVVGLIRGVSENFGAIGGAAMIYTVASVFLFFTFGLAKIRDFPRRYLIWGSLLFVAYELCFSLSIGYANNGRQAIEVGMVNYLWPSLTMVAAILFNQQKSSFWVIPGFFISVLGICWILGGEQGLNIQEMVKNIQDNPLSYGMAFAGALIWAAYCTITAKLAGGKNGVTFFFMVVAVVLWGQYFITGGGTIVFSYRAVIYLVLAASAMGFGYAVWNVGIMHGNVTLLAGASNFIPVLSAVLAAMILHTPLSMSFWQGTLMVCIGSVICWIAMRTRRAKQSLQESS